MMTNDDAPRSKVTQLREMYVVVIRSQDIVADTSSADSPR